METQWICRAEPHCLCVGENKWDQCSCDRNPATNICGDCGQPMEEIDFETGEAPDRSPE